jgi:protein-S-isoprenylcysteine O-methyltransferase Ste14
MNKTYVSSYSDSMMVQLGNWIFHIRNFLFPVFYIALFIPSRRIFDNMAVADVIGLALIFSGILIRSITIGLVYIVRGGKNRKIYADNLVTSGIYSICRNPMYLGNILLLLGFGIFANSLLFLLLFFPLFLLFYFAIMKAEEDFLLKKFGQEFETYRFQVNSLLPDLRKLNSAFAGQRFNFQKVIKKEYNSLFIYFSGILLLLVFNERMDLLVFMFGMGMLLILYILVKYLKYQHKLG